MSVEEVFKIYDKYADENGKVDKEGFDAFLRELESKGYYVAVGGRKKSDLKESAFEFEVTVKKGSKTVCNLLAIEYEEDGKKYIELPGLGLSD